MNDAISRSAVLDRLQMLRRNYKLKAGYRDAMTDAIGEVCNALTIDAIPVVHYKDTNTTVLNVKSIEDWKDRIILDEGEESHRGAVYYADSDDMVRVVRCKDCANTDGEVGLPEGMFYCNEWDSMTRGHWYCCRGERKEEG